MAVAVGGPAEAPYGLLPPPSGDATALQPGELADHGVHLAGRNQPFLVTEQVRDSEVGLLLRTDARSRWRPQVPQRPPRHGASLLASAQAHPGLGAVEGEVPPLV